MRMKRLPLGLSICVCLIVGLISSFCRGGDVPTQKASDLGRQLKCEDYVAAVSFSAKDEYLACVGGFGINVWKLNSPSIVWHRIGKFREPRHPCASFDPKTDHLFVGNEYRVGEVGLSYRLEQTSGERSLFEDMDFGPRSMKYPFSWACYSIVFSPDANLSAFGFSRYDELGVHSGRMPTKFPSDLVVKSGDQNLEVDERLARLTKENGLRSLAFNSDGRFLAIGGRIHGSPRDGGFIVLAEIDNKKVVQRYGPVNYGSDSINRVVYSRDNRFIALGTKKTSSDGRGQVIVLNGKTLESVSRFECCPSSVMAISFSYDSSVLFAGGDDAEIHMFSTTDWRSIGELKGHSGYVNDIQLSSDGKRLASASDDKSVILWKLKE